LRSLWRDKKFQRSVTFPPSRNTYIPKLKQLDLHNTFISLIKEHERMIHKVCYIYADNRDDRKDLYQEIVLQAWKSFKSFRGDARFSTWLYQVAINTAITGLHRRKRSVVTNTYDGNLPEPADDRTDNKQLELLHRAIAKLNEIEKAMVMLYLDDKSYDEMQDILGIPNGTLRVKMTRIKEKLRQITKNS